MAKNIDLFLSHNNADKPWTERLATAVEADRSGPPLKVFFDKWDIPHGGDIPAELEEGLRNSRYVGLVLSPESLSSDWVTLERSTAIHRDPRARQRSLIPLLRRTCDMPDMLARLKYIDFRREQDFDAGLAALVGILRGRPAQRGGEVDPADVHFCENAALPSACGERVERGGGVLRAAGCGTRKRLRLCRRDVRNQAGTIPGIRTAHRDDKACLRSRVPVCAALQAEAEAEAVGRHFAFWR